MPQSRKLKNRTPRYGGKRSRTQVSKPFKRRPRANDSSAGGNSTQIRLQKVLAAAGIASRRQCEELIRQGRVDVDGETVSELGTRVDPARQKIRVDGELVHRPKRKLYYLINKPAGIISTTNDPSGRPRVIDLAPTHERLFTVGRLDKSSSGLILATNDGELTDLLTHPRYGVEKTYLALVAGVPTAEALAKLQRGVHLSEGHAHAKRIAVRRTQRHSTLLEIVLDEGRNREVRRLLARIGHKILSLRRVAIGSLRLGNLQPGENRPLRLDEVQELYDTARKRREKPTRPRDKQRANESSKGTSSRTERASETLSSVHPLIDKSLPSDALTDDEGFVPTVFSDDLSEEAHLSHVLDDECEDDDANIETTPIDLSPLVPGRSGRAENRTVIGADSSRSKNRSGKSNHRHRRSGRKR